MRINSYLTFNGNCREAMSFYKKCLGGKLIFQTVGESPLSSKMPDKMKKAILHSTLTKGELLLMGSDMADSTGRQAGNAVSMMLNCDSEREIRSLYKKLSAGGEQTHQMELTFRGALFGDLRDKFGNRWLLHFQKPTYTKITMDKKR